MPTPPGCGYVSIGGASTSTTTQRLEPGRAAALLPEHDDHRGARRSSLVLFLASMAAFVVSRYSWRFNLLLLMVFTARNLLPPQVIITPLYRMYLALPLPRRSATTGCSTTSTSAIVADPHRVPAGLLHLRAQQLHEDVAQGAERGRGRRRRVGLDDVLAGHPAADRSPRWRPWRRSRSPSSTTTSSGRSS